jgi:hypothetical protein
MPIHASHLRCFTHRDAQTTSVAKSAGPAKLCAVQAGTLPASGYGTALMRMHRAIAPASQDGSISRPNLTLRSVSRDLILCLTPVRKFGICKGLCGPRKET